MSPSNTRGRWVAIVTGAVSVAIGLFYLTVITVLDARGPMLPPPPEALGEVEVGAVFPAEEVQQPAAELSAESAPKMTLDG